MDSFVKAAEDISQQLARDSRILVIDAPRMAFFAHVLGTFDPRINKLEPYQVISLETLIPNVHALLAPNSVPLYYKYPIVTNFIKEYGESWIPIISMTYKQLSKQSFLDNPGMEPWERYFRAQKSNNKQELGALSIDDNVEVRATAQLRLKDVSERKVHVLKKRSKKTT